MVFGQSDYSSLSQPVVRMRCILVRQVRKGPHWRKMSSESDNDDIQRSYAFGEICNVSANKSSTHRTS